MDFTGKTFVRTAVLHDKPEVICHLVSKGANIDTVISVAKELKHEAVGVWAQLYKFNKGRGEK